MRTITMLGIAALLAAVIASAWGMTRGTTAPTQNPATDKAGMIDPLEMMKKAKDLPVHIILDLI